MFLIHVFLDRSTSLLFNNSICISMLYANICIQRFLNKGSILGRVKIRYTNTSEI